jgi:predicted small lipoprotein YifL
MRNYIVKFFHTAIIASFLFTLSGCGYKADPVYTPSEDSQNIANR